MAHKKSGSGLTRELGVAVPRQLRAFRTSHFSKAAKRAGISDGELHEAGRELSKGQRENITREELAGFKKLAKDYSAVDEATLDRMLKNGDLEEITDGSKKE